MSLKRPDFEKVAERVIKYVQYVIIAVLVVTEILAITATVSNYMDYDLIPKIAVISSVALACVALTILECISMYLVKAFRIKMVFFSFECLIMVGLGIITGSILVLILFCAVLTECYINLEKFIDKFIMLVCSCAFYVISYVIGWVMVNAGASVINSIVIILSSCLYGIIVLFIDFIVVEILMYFYKKNIELRHALKDAEESKTELKGAYAKLAETSVYEERNRIARDIHDNAGHSITSVIMQTEAAKLTIDTDPEQAKRSIIAANMQAKNALEQMRASVHLLAGRTNDLALKTDIEAVIMETTAGTDIKIRSDLDDIAVPEAVFRYVSNTVKECIANGLRHGGATAFYIEMKQQGSALHLLISDNGTGIPGDIQEGFGLKGIREGAAQLGGRCSFTTEEDDGFEADILLPLPETPAPAAPAGAAETPAAKPAAPAAPAARTPSAATAASAAPAAASAPAAAERAYAATARNTARANERAAEASAGAQADAAEADAKARANAEAYAVHPAMPSPSHEVPAVSAAVPEASTDAYAAADTSAAEAATETLDATYVASKPIEEE